VKLRNIVLISMVLVAGTVVRAQEEEASERVDLRVSSTGPGAAVVVDRGKRDGLALGDRVLFHPREGGTYGGAVVRLDERSAVVELDDKSFVPVPGTRGEVRIPRSRIAPEKPEEKPTPPEGAPEHPPWEKKEEPWSPDKPLLAEVKPVRPKERARRFTGRFYMIGETAQDPENDFGNSFFRAGTDLLYENPFDRGGELRLNTELDYLTEPDDDEDLNLLVRWLSYSWGGTRFSDMRWEVGRFLQYGMPEFGVLDGVEWGRRRKNGHRYGLSMGFMPEPDENFDTLTDFQVAGYYEWVADLRERLTIGGGFQKTWHGTTPDRDLLIAKIRYLPGDGWSFHSTVWVDFYTGGDNVKGSGAEVTQAVASLSRRWKNGNGLDLTYSRIRFPELDRNGEFTPPQNARELADNRYDRLALDGWLEWSQHRRVHGHISGYDDEDDSGAAAEMGIEVPDLFLDRTHTDITAFGTVGQFETVIGGRVSWSRFTKKGRWDVLYEVGNHHLSGFPSNADDLLQHRLRASLNLYIPAGWDLSVYGQGVLFDKDVAWSVGFTLQKDF
jgi:hypothetical protein